MLATVLYAAHDVRVANVPDAVLIEPIDAIVRVTLACVSSSGLRARRDMNLANGGQSVGHEALAR